MVDPDANRSDPFHDVINLLAAPLASGIRSYEQFRTGIDELFRTIENLNATMENLNETAERVNRLLNDVEEPIRAVVPQITRIASSPAVTALPHRLEELVEVLGDATRRLAPLAQLAESAGGMFGLRLPGFGGGSHPEPSPEAGPTATTPNKTAPNKAVPKKAPPKKAAAKKAASKKSAGR